MRRIRSLRLCRVARAALAGVVTGKKIRRLMRAHDLQPRRRRRFVATTDSDHDRPIFPDRAKGMVVDAPNQLWVADITYIAIAVGFVYLAAILDAWSRRVVGYAISRSVDAQLTLAALQPPVNARRPSNLPPPYAARRRVDRSPGRRLKLVRRVGMQRQHAVRTCADLSRLYRTLCPARITPVDPFQEIAQLSRRDLHSLAGAARRPDEFAGLKALNIQRHADGLWSILGDEVRQRLGPRQR